MGTPKEAEKKVILELTNILRKNTDKVLSGETKLCLTTSSIGILATHFRRYSDNTDDDENEVTGRSSYGKRSKVKQTADELKLWRENVRVLVDFLIKIKGLKIIHGSYTIKEPVQIARFRSLHILEVKKVPIHMLEGLSKLRGQLREIIITKSLQKLQDILEICGGDRSPGLVWSHLKTAYFSFNGLTQLDNSLRFVPFLEVLDLSHNNITKTDNHLQHIADMVRINLGYNLLKKIPDFSFSNTSKLKTLVLRNNDLDNLDGIEELVALEELDVTDNCIIDHASLLVLGGLNRLQILCLMGNPLFYKSNHRLLTVGYVSPEAGLGIFLLDGKKLSAEEIVVLKQNHYQKFNDQHDGRKNGGGPSTSYRRDTTVILAENQPSTSSSGSLLAIPVSTHVKKKKRGHKRIQSKERVPTITDIEDSTQEEFSKLSNGGSSSGSYVPVEDVDGIDQVEEDKKKIAIMREHYKDDWLKALSADQNRFDESDSMVSKGGDSSDKVGGVDVEDSEVQETSHTRELSDDGSAKERAIGSKDVTDRETENSTATKTSNQRVDKPTTPLSPFSPEVHIVDTTDIYSLQRSHTTRSVTTDGQTLVNRMDSMSPDHTRAALDEQYGDESEPYIVMLPTSDMRQMFVTVNNRYIIEKDINGAVLEALDLKCLKSVEKSDEKCYGKDIIGGLSFVVQTLEFDYVKKDMRQRKYAMEDDNDAQAFGSLISSHLKDKQPVVEAMECLKCKHQFNSHDVNTIALLACPKCHSKMVFKLDPAQTDTIAKQPAIEDEDNKLSDRMSKGSPMSRRKAMKRGKNSGAVENEPVTLRGGVKSDVARLRVSEDVLQDRNSLRQAIYGSIDATDGTEDTNNSEATSDTSSKPTNNIPVSDSTTKVETQEASCMKSNNSWSDVRSSMSHSGARSSISSVESDITILATNSRGSVAIISESNHEGEDNNNEVFRLTNSGHEILSDRSTHTNSKQSANFELNQNKGDFGQITRDENMTGAGNSVYNWTRANQGQLTPVGSPLSNSVCSSMVSSVYENTLSGAGDDNTSGIEDNVADNTHENSLTSSSTDSVSIRHIPGTDDKRSRRSTKHRTAIIYAENLDTNSSQNNKDLSQFIETETVSMTKTGAYIETSKSEDDSIYNTANFTQSRNTSALNSANVSINIEDSTRTSIYDTVSSDMESDLSSEQKSNDFKSFFSQNQSMTRSDHSSPLRRSNRSRSRESGNRSAIYGAEFTDANLEIDTKEKSSLLEFPTDLSPIKRTSSSRESRRNRSAAFIGNDELVFTREDPESNTHNVSRSLDITRSSGVSSEVKTDSTNLSHNISQGSVDSRQLPWELENNQSEASTKDKKDESLNHDEFVNIDHRIQLYLELKVFKADEICQCAIQCNIVQYINTEEIKSLMIISSHRILIFRVEGDMDSSNASDDWLKCYEDQPITEVHYIDSGLGHQSLRVEFGTECSSYTLLIADEGRCKKFLTLLSGIVQSAAMHDDSRLAGITKSNPNTLENLSKEVLQASDDQEQEVDEEESLVKYLIIKYMDEEEENEEGRTMSIVVTTTELVLIDENHQWPLPRLQAPLSPSIKGRQFTVVQREKINNIESLMFNEYNPCELRMTFFENSDINNAKPVWMISMVTTKGVKSLVDAIREPWEQEFGVSLDVTSTSFSDSG